jgi:sterol desaturase/sphingolipid hydroxylase (fatty acid hydroxylase superfamily)
MITMNSGTKKSHIGVRRRGAGAGSAVVVEAFVVVTAAVVVVGATVVVATVAVVAVVSVVAVVLVVVVVVVVVLVGTVDASTRGFGLRTGFFCAGGVSRITSADATSDSSANTSTAMRFMKVRVYARRIAAMRANLLYVALYASGIYGLVLWPPVQRIVSWLAAPLRDGLAPLVDAKPLAVRILVAFVLFDFLAYWVHRAAHASALLWRVHRVHHAEQAFGPLTTFRFHVAEVAWRMAVQFIPLYLLGIAANIPRSVYIAFIAFNVLAHSGLGWTFGAVGRALVSPAYHGDHHRGERRNYAMFLPFWDDLFGTRYSSAS